MSEKLINSIIIYVNSIHEVILSNYIIAKLLIFKRKICFGLRKYFLSFLNVLNFLSIYDIYNILNSLFVQYLDSVQYLLNTYRLKLRNLYSRYTDSGSEYSQKCTSVTILTIFKI